MLLQTALHCGRRHLLIHTAGICAHWQDLSPSTCIQILSSTMSMSNVRLSTHRAHNATVMSSAAAMPQVSPAALRAVWSRLCCAALQSHKLLQYLLYGQGSHNNTRQGRVCLTHLSSVVMHFAR
jgi:hypothetical protein